MNTMPTSSEIEGESQFRYVGQELKLFWNARNWKRYWSQMATPFLRGAVCEVGAGIGGSTPYLRTGGCTSWMLLEPDKAMSSWLQDQIPESIVDLPAEVFQGTLQELPLEYQFDTITYIDVLEHIEKDYDEVSEAEKRLKPGGCLIVLAPAMPWLFSPFDESVGHFRRYVRKDGSRLSVPGLELVKAQYLDGVGAMLNLGNRLLLSQSQPTVGQITFWDRWVVPISRWVDPVVASGFGRSILLVWRKHRTVK